MDVHSSDLSAGDPPQMDIDLAEKDAPAFQMTLEMWADEVKKFMVLITASRSLMLQDQ